MRKWITYGSAVVMALVLLLGTGTWAPTPARVAEANPGTQWQAEYFNNTNLSGAPVVSRIDDQINFDWGTGSPDPAITSDNFSARWTKTVNFDPAGQWVFRAGADDGIRVWVDVTLVIDQWHGAPQGFTTYEATLYELTAGPHALKVEYFESSGPAKVQVSWQKVGGAASGISSATTGGPASWSASYFNNPTLSGNPVVTRTDGDINFDWGAGSPDPAVPADNFSARWTATVDFPTTGRWRFKVTVDDGVRMWIDVTLIIDKWQGSPSGTATYEVDVDPLTAGPHALKVEYYEASAGAKIQVRWEGPPGATATGQTVPQVPPAPKPVIAAVTADLLNVRSGPGQGYPVVAQVVYPENYVVLGAVPDMTWILIQLDEKTGAQGWVSNDWVWLFSKDAEANKDANEDSYQDFVFTIPRIDIEVAPPAAAAIEPQERVILRGQAIDNLNLRDGPSAYAAKDIGGIPQNAVFNIEARSANGAWYLITYQNVRGWVYAPVVNILEGRVQDLLVSAEVVPAPPGGTNYVVEDAAGKPAVTVRGRTIDNIKFRDVPSLFVSKEIGSVPLGTEFVIEARNANGAWYRVTFEGRAGWINAAYVTLIEGTVQDLPIE